MLADIRLADIMIEQRRIGDARARDDDQQITFCDLGSAAFGVRGWIDEGQILELQFSEPDVLRPDKAGTGSRIELGPSTRSACHHVAHLTEGYRTPQIGR